MYPPDFACTLARFVLMYFVRIGEYFEVFWQVFSEIVLQIPQEAAFFAERILRKEREWSDLSSLAPRYRSLAGSLPGRARVHRAVLALYAWSLQACTRSQGNSPLSPCTASANTEHCEGDTQSRCQRVR
jgi:hypothetical protein